MNCIICANKVSSNILAEFVQNYSSLNLVGTFSDLDLIKIQLLKKEDIDLFFIDMDIPDIDIFDFISTLDYLPNIIIISSTGQNALKAFDFNVVDYLLKPVTYSRFCKAVDKSLNYYSHKESTNIGSNEIFLKKGSTLIKLKLNDIIYIEALENYITLYTSNEKYTIHFTMKAIENNLTSGIFIRVHRSFIVNKSMIQTIKEKSLDLMFGSEIKNLPIGKSYRDYLLSKINTMTR